MAQALLSFAGLCVLLAITPGPDTLLVLRSAARAGRRAGLLTGAGAALGSIGWAGAVAVGLAAALHQWSSAYSALRLLGGLYLIYLGLRTLWESRRPSAPAMAPSMPLSEGQELTGWQAWRAGLFSALLNPKIGLFFLAVVPQFLPAEYSVWTGTLLLGLVDSLVAMTWLALVAIGAAAVMRWLARPGVNRTVERLAGLTLVGLGGTTLRSP